MHPDWARSVRDQCAAAGVAFMLKQWGEWIEGDRNPFAYPKGTRIRGNVTKGRADRNPITMARLGKHKTGRKLDGEEHLEFPAQPNQENGQI